MSLVASLPGSDQLAVSASLPLLPALMWPTDTFHSHQAIRQLCPFAVKRARERRKEERLGLGGESGQGRAGCSQSVYFPRPWSILLAAATAFLISLLSSAQRSSAQRRLKQEAVYLSSALYLHSGSSQICLARPAPKKHSLQGGKKDRKRLQKDKSIEKHPLSPRFTIPQSLCARFLSLLYSVLSSLFPSLGT